MTIAPSPPSGQLVAKHSNTCCTGGLPHHAHLYLPVQGGSSGAHDRCRTIGQSTKTEFEPICCTVQCGEGVSTPHTTSCSLPEQCAPSVKHRSRDPLLQLLVTGCYSSNYVLIAHTPQLQTLSALPIYPGPAIHNQHVRFPNGISGHALHILLL